MLVVRRRTHSVTPAEREVYQRVWERDGGRCVAPVLDPEIGACGGGITRQHVRISPGMPRITDIDHVLLLCEWHHLYGWAQSKRGLAMQRRYLGLVVD